jgi:hypothetical protein
MAGERLARILSLLPAAGPGDGDTSHLCEVSAGLAEVTGAGIMLMSGDVPRGSACTSDDVSALIEELQLTLGEGPCIDAFRHDRPVLEADLAEPHTPRWPAFSPPAVEAGARAVFGFPLQVGAVRLGALNLYRDRCGPLSVDQHADTLVIAGVAARSLIAMQAQASPGELAHELDVGGDFRAAVHQATGMVAAQVDVSVAEALVRLRAHAFATDRTVSDVARDVVARRLRFGEDGAAHQPGSGRQR